MNTHVDFAILAPVPIDHLEEGVKVCVREGYVAYGSLKWELFPKIDAMRGDEPVPVLIYPSYEDEQAKIAYEIRWTGFYIGHVRTDDGIHPDGMKFRPATAHNYPNDMSGYWAVYWHVAELTPLPEDERRPISSLRSHKSRKHWKAGSPPRGPEIVERPRWI